MAVQKCRECGKEMKDKGYQGYCHDCYAEIWDNGFESTSEHAYEIGFKDLVKKLDQNCNDDFRKAIREIIGEWGPLEWKCGKCKSVRISKEDSKEMPSNQKMELLCGKCPDCGADGHVVPGAPKKFFN